MKKTTILLLPIILTLSIWFSIWANLNDLLWDKLVSNSNNWFDFSNLEMKPWQTGSDDTNISSNTWDWIYQEYLRSHKDEIQKKELEKKLEEDKKKYKNCLEIQSESVKSNIDLNIKYHEQNYYIYNPYVPEPNEPSWLYNPIYKSWIIITTDNNIFNNESFFWTKNNILITRSLDNLNNFYNFFDKWTILSWNKIIISSCADLDITIWNKLYIVDYSKDYKWNRYTIWEWEWKAILNKSSIEIELNEKWVQLYKWISNWYIWIDIKSNSKELWNWWSFIVYSKILNTKNSLNISFTEIPNSKYILSESWQPYYIFQTNNSYYISWKNLNTKINIPWLYFINNDSIKIWKDWKDYIYMTKNNWKYGIVYNWKTLKENLVDKPYLYLPEDSKNDLLWYWEFIWEKLGINRNNKDNIYYTDHKFSEDWKDYIYTKMQSDKSFINYNWIDWKKYDSINDTFLSKNWKKYYYRAKEWNKYFLVINWTEWRKCDFIYHLKVTPDWNSYIYSCVIRKYEHKDWGSVWTEYIIKNWEVVWTYNFDSYNSETLELEISDNWYWYVLLRKENSKIYLVFNWETLNYDLDKYYNFWLKISPDWRNYMLIIPVIYSDFRQKEGYRTTYKYIYSWKESQKIFNQIVYIELLNWNNFILSVNSINNSWVNESFIVLNWVQLKSYDLLSIKDIKVIWNKVYFNAKINKLDYSVKFSIPDNVKEYIDQKTVNNYSYLTSKEISLIKNKISPNLETYSKLSNKLDNLLKKVQSTNDKSKSTKKKIDMIKLIIDEINIYKK